MKQPIICQHCRQPISGHYVQALGANWHPDHFCCAQCGKPIGESVFYQHQKQPYHRTCYLNHISERCVYCGKPLLKQFIEDYWGNKFCSVHRQEYQSCCFCGRLVPPRHQERYADGKVRCPICRSNSIDRMSQARPIFIKLVKQLNNQGLWFNNFDLRLDMRNQSEIAQFVRKSRAVNVLGAASHATYTQNGKILRTQANGVAVLRGLPRTLFQGVAIHELGHTWLAVHNIIIPQLRLEEGFCELLAYRFYQDAGTQESLYYARSIIRNPDPIYGDGFRLLHTLNQKYRFEHLIELLYATKKLPKI